jgi:hypothetical protein
MSDKPSAPERVQDAYRSLSASAANLNAASDELRKTISVLEETLKQLNLGISTWATITGDEDPNGDYWSRDLGYARVSGKWGIALREVSGNYNHEEYEKDETWLFNDAPRWLRIEGVGKIPELLEKLTKQADDTTERIRRKTAEAKELATAINAAAAESKATMPLSSLVGAITPGPISPLTGAFTPGPAIKMRK